MPMKHAEISSASHAKRSIAVGFAVMLLGGMVGGLAQTSMNTVLTVLQNDLGIPVTQGQWLTNVFPLTLGVVIPLVAFLSRRYDARKLFLVALVLFITGSAIISGASTLPLLIVGRILQGAAAGIILPLLQVVALSRFPRERRGFVMGWVGLAMGFAPNVGPTIAGAFTTAFGWRSAFLFLLAFGVCVLVAALFLVKPMPPESDDAPHADMPSVLLSTGGFGGVLMGVVEASSYGFVSWQSLGAAAVGVVCLVVFCRRQLKLEHPLLDIRVFKYRDFTVSIIMVCLLFCAFIGVTLVIPLCLQGLHGFNALQSGMVLLPGTVAALFTAPITGYLQDRVGTRRIALVGSTLLVVGTIGILRLGGMDDLTVITAWQTVRAFGIMCLVMPLTTWGLNVLPADVTPDGTSMTNALRQVAGSFSMSIMVLMMAGGEASGAISEQGVNNAMLFSLVAVMALLLLVFVFVRDRVSATENQR